MHETRTILVLAALVIVVAGGLLLLFLVRPPEVPPLDRGSAAPEETGNAAAETEAVSDSTAIAPDDEESPAEREALPDVSVFLYGIVVDPAGNPIERASVEILRPDAPRARYPYGPNQRTQDGTFALAGLRPGTWLVRADAEEYREIEGLVEIGRAPYRRLDLRLIPSFRIPVRIVTPEGKPLADRVTDWRQRRGLTVIGTREAPGKSLPMVATASVAGFGMGRYHGITFATDRTLVEVAPGFDGVFVSDEPPPLFLSFAYKHVILDTVPVVEGMEEAVLTASKDAIETSNATVRVRVVDARTGAPIPEATVSIDDAQTGPQGTKVDETGSVTLESVAPGLMKLMISVSDPIRQVSMQYTFYTEFVRVASGADLDLGAIPLDRDTSVEVRVADPDGNPIPCGVWTRNLDRMPMPQPLNPNVRIQTREDGSVELGGLVPGTTAVYADLGSAFATGFESSERWVGLPALIRPGEAREGPVTIEVRPATDVYVEYVVDPDSICFTVIRDERGIPVAGDRVDSHFPQRLHFLPGSYTLTAYRGDELLRTIPLTVGADTMHLAVDLTGAPGTESVIATAPGERTIGPLPPSAVARSEERDTPPDDFPPGPAPEISLAGRLLNPSGNPVERGWVSARNEANDRLSGSVTESSYTILGITPGRWTLDFGADGFAREKEEVEIPAAPLFQTRDLVLRQPTIMIAVSMKTLDGEPLLEAIREKVGVTRNFTTHRKIRDVQVIASTTPFPSALPEGTRPDRASDAGNYRPGSWGRSAGTLTITKPLPVYVGIHAEGRVLGTQVLDSPVSELTLVCDPSEILGLFELGEITVRLRVVDSETRELLRPEAAVLVSPFIFLSDVKAPTRIDADGSVVLTWDQPGEARLLVRCEGYTPLDRRITIPAGPVADLGEIPMEPLSGITGTVVDEDGRPVSCRVIVRRLDGETSVEDSASWRFLRSDAEGRFEAAVGRGRYEVRVPGPGWIPSRTVVDTTEGSVRDLRIVVRSGVEVVLEWKGDEAREAELRIVGEAGEEILAQDTYLYTGTFRMRLAPGAYTAELTTPDGATRLVPFVVATEPRKVDLTP